LARNCPESPKVAFVHGDYRLGNLMFDDAAGLAAVLDWEMATTGDPLADLGYLTATWAQEGEEPNPMHELSKVTRMAGFPGRDALARSYAETTGLPLDALPWYQVPALWKAAVFLEGSYGRYLDGASSDAYFAGLGEGVPAIGRAALLRAETA
jgi:aminoglycoside phosphotransferase (APT) family kinase protein